MAHFPAIFMHIDLFENQRLFTFFGFSLFGFSTFALLIHKEKTNTIAVVIIVIATPLL